MENYIFLESVKKIENFYGQIFRLNIFFIVN